MKRHETTNSELNKALALAKEVTESKMTTISELEQMAAELTRSIGERDIQVKQAVDKAQTLEQRLIRDNQPRQEDWLT